MKPIKLAIVLYTGQEPHLPIIVQDGMDPEAATRIRGELNYYCTSRKAYFVVKLSSK